MAGDWIKMREDLHEDPAVLFIADKLATRPEHVVGYCHKFWSWVSRQCNAGTVTGVTLDSLGSVLSLPGFPQMLVEVGWLEYDNSASMPLIKIPNFERHLSQGAKARGLTALRVRNARVTEPLRSERNNSVTREEKRRVFLSLEKKEPKKAFARPTVEDVRTYCTERGNAVDPDQWFAYYEANGWRVGRNPMKDWQASVRTWEKNGLRYAANGAEPAKRIPLSQRGK
jgi:hypothetical protein